MDDAMDRERVTDELNAIGFDGIEFIEFATSKPQALGGVLETMGFRPIAHHRSREVELYRQGSMNIVVNAQPLLERTELGDFAFAHNGNLTNTDNLRETLSPSTVLQATSDSEVMAKLIVETKGSMLERIASVLKVARGALFLSMVTTSGWALRVRARRPDSREIGAAGAFDSSASG